MKILKPMFQQLEQGWDVLQDGWRHLWQHSSHGLTRFRPEADKSKTPQTTIEGFEFPQWGLLTADVSEDTNNVYIRFEAPGLNSEDFDIQVDDRTLTIHGTKHAEHETKTSQFHLSECAYGEFERHIPLPCTVVEGQAHAKYNKGILNITFPKRGHSETHKIKIED